MSKKRGLTLMEILLTTVLMSILTASLFKLNSHRSETLQVIKNNTIALYALESARNHTLMLYENGNGEVREATGILPKNSWSGEWSVDKNLVTIKLQNKKSTLGRIYQTEVQISEP